jgi:trimeric autotransporter adhesin
LHGWNNTFLGAFSNGAGTGFFNCIAIGANAVTTASNQVRIGNSSNNSIGGYANWTNLSDGRFKKNIKEDVKGLDFIMQLRPVTYQLDITGLRQKLNESNEDLAASKMDIAIAEKESLIQTGFIAQEVEMTAKKLGYDFSGVDKPKNENDMYGLRYAEFVVPLVKAVQEQQKLIETLQSKITLLEMKINPEPKTTVKN